MIDTPEIVVLQAPATTNGGVTTDYISLKNVHSVRAIFTFKQAAGHATGIDPTQSTTVAGGNVKAITSTVPIWVNEDVAASSILTRQADAITFNVANDIKDKVVVMDIDPAGLDVAGGFDVLGFNIDDSSQAGNLVSVVAIITPRYPGANVIVD